MTKKASFSNSISDLRESLERLTNEASNGSLTSGKRKNLETHIKEAIDALKTLLTRLDPIAQPTSVFDPSNPKVVGRFVALALVAQSGLLKWQSAISKPSSVLRRNYSPWFYLSALASRLLTNTTTR